MPYSPLTHNSVFLHVFGEPEGLPLLESLINDYDKLQPVISLNFLEYEISKKGPWLHHYHLPHTAHLGFIFVELPKLLRSPGRRSQLKKAAIWGTFLEKPDVTPPNKPAELVALTGVAKQRMEAYMRIAPEVYHEIRRSMALHDIASYRGEGFREGEALGEARGLKNGKVEGKVEVATTLLARGMSVADVAEITGLPVTDLE